MLTALIFQMSIPLLLLTFSLAYNYAKHPSALTINVPQGNPGHSSANRVSRVIASSQRPTLPNAPPAATSKKSFIIKSA